MKSLKGMYKQMLVDKSLKDENEILFDPQQVIVEYKWISIKCLILNKL